ncbi:collagen alpha-1(I) chain-like [Helicoverpa zea]|uniref:collagen alpha-1(I) chain-like n=1 Tax=Helicoverpa zea TaxID=7113 RepID=UPI001F583BBA|nr:collagen alpha-1(I) chain-like [Helicoverpa zea]
MGEATWILRINIFVSVFLVIRPSEFPSFFDDDDLKDLGVKGHKSQYNPPTATGRSTDHGPGYVPAPRNDENTAIIPPNGLPVKKKPFNPYEEEEGESIFPEDDGKAFGGDDFTDLDQLWDEFRKLVAMEGEKYKDGEIMENWEDDAHMWAGRMRPNLPVGSPSHGLSAYWSDNEDEIPKDSTNQASPWEQSPAEGERFDFQKYGVQDPSEPKPQTGGPGPGMPFGPAMGQSPGSGMNMGGPPPWAQGGGPPRGPHRAPVEPGGSPPTGMKQGGQGASGIFLGGAPPPGWHPGKAPGGTSLGLPPTAQTQGASGGMNMEGMPPGMGQAGPHGRGMSMNRPPPGWGQTGGQLPGGGINMAGPLSGVGQGAGQLPGGGINMAGPLSGVGQGAGRIPGGAMSMNGPPPGWGPGGGQDPSEGMDMDGPPAGWGQGGSQGPGGEMSMDGPPPGWSQDEDQDSGEEMSMEGPPPGWGQDEGQSPGEEMGIDGPPPGWGQSGSQGPGEDTNMEGPPPGWGPSGFQGSGGKMSMNGPPPGWGQGMDQGPGRGMGKGGPPPGLGKGRLLVPGGGMKMGKPPPGWSQGGGKFPGEGMNMGGPLKGWGQRPGPGINMAGPPPNWGQGGVPPRDPSLGRGIPKSGMSSFGPGVPNPLGGLGQGGVAPRGPKSLDFGMPRSLLSGYGQGGPYPSGGLGKSGVPPRGPGLGRGSPKSGLSSFGPGGPNPLGGLGQGGPPQPQGPVGQPMKVNRRQMEEDMPEYGNPNDNLMGPLYRSLPPASTVYYKGNNPDLPEDRLPTAQDDRWMLPGQEQPEPTQSNELELDDLKRLQPRPNMAGSFVLSEPVNTHPVFDMNARPDSMPVHSGGRMPGPGSERDFPNGYIPHEPTPLQMYQNIMHSAQNDASQERVNAPFGSNYPKSMAEALRGVNIPGVGDFTDANPEMQKALRMGGPGGFQGPGGPGSESNSRVARENAKRGPPGVGYNNWGSSVMQVRTPIIEPHPRPGMDRARYPEWKHNDELPEYQDSPKGGEQGAWQSPDGSSGFSPPGEPAFQPPGMDDGEGLELPQGMHLGPVSGKDRPPPEAAYPDDSDIPSSVLENLALRQKPESKLSKVVKMAIKYSTPEEDQGGFKPKNRNLVPTKEEILKGLPLYVSQGIC